MKIPDFFAELKRRRIYQVGIAYLVISWVLLQVVSVIAPIIEAPDWISKLVLITLIVMFPITLIVTWAQGLTKSRSRSKDQDEDSSLESEVRNKDGHDLASIAVIPFEDLSPDGDQEYFTKGMSDEVIIALNQLPNLRVISRTSVSSIKGKHLDLVQIGKTLKVNHLLEGSIRKVGNQLRITTNLIDVTNDAHVWSERYDRELKDVFSIQDDISQNVARAVRGFLTIEDENALQRPTTNIEAYTYFLKGRQFLHELDTTKAIEMFEHAIELDDKYAPGYAGLADVHSWMYQWEGAQEVDLKAAEKYSKLAMTLAPDLSESHSSRAFVLSLAKDFEQAEDLFNKALELNPNSFTSLYFYARMSFNRGEIEKSANLFSKAAQINKEDYQSMILLGQSLTLLKDPIGRERSLEGIERARRHLQLNPGDVRAWALGATTMMNLGLKQEAFKWVSRALEIRPDDPSVLYNAACLHAINGDQEKSLDLLENYVKKSGNKDWIKNDPDLDSLREDPRFIRFLETLE